MEMDGYFASRFRLLTGNGARAGYEPLRWQIRLFESFCRNDVPKTCDLPTGMGKTSVIHLWLLALLHQREQKKKPCLPTRLVYVVDRRTVVDQATEIVEGIKRNLPSLGLGKDWLAVSTLRGQFADNREWTRDPSRPAIIIGTVDMIGSRLLFSGYRSSYKRRPLEAGMLGQDAFLVLDEAHLSEPFAKLTRWIEGRNPDSLRVMHMSATSPDGDRDAFTLVRSDLEGNPDTNPIIRRYEAKKRLRIHEGIADLPAAITQKATELAKDRSRVVVFVRSPEAATRIARAIQNHVETKEKPFRNSVAVLTGTMRGLERDELLKKPENESQYERRVMQRFLDPVNVPENGPAILISTSAGEVGFDLNADHLVCDDAPLDSIIQRFGRVNRRGDGIAQIHLFVEKVKESAKKYDGKRKPRKPSFETASAEALQVLKQLPKHQEDSTGIIYDASPKVFASIPKPKDALSPKPVAVEATDILLDAWSMTSITDPMPGRPPVAPWLRGIDETLPQTTIAWRAELEIVPESEFEVEAFEAIFQKHRIRPHETLTTRTDYVIEFLKKAVKANPSLSDTRVVVLGRELRTASIRALLADSSHLRADPTLVLPCSFGGLDSQGMLDDKSVAAERDSELADTRWPLDVADALHYERELDAAPRLRILLSRAEDGWSVKQIAAATISENFKDLPNDDPDGLIEAIKNRLGMNLRLRLPLTSDDEGNVTCSFVSLYPARSRKPASKQPLNEHVETVEQYACQIGRELQLAEPFLSALRSAAKYHDEGKKTRTWQYAVRNKDLCHPLGKSGGKMNVKRLAGYRHEFGSLLRVRNPEQPTADLPDSPESLDLMLHLIATHHGAGRPHFKKPDDIDFDDRKRCPLVGIEVVLRFARLQRKYGHWRLAWLENLLRCADAMASAENDEEET